MEYIATFDSHFGAIQYRRACEKAGFPAKIMPVPRNLSSSCGTCVSFVSPDGIYPPANEELEQIVSVEKTGFCQVYAAEEA